MSGPKGGSQQTSQSGTSATQIPSWLESAAQGAVGTAQNLAANPNLFAPYPGQQVANVPQTTNQAYAQIGNLQGSTAPNVASANALYGLAQQNMDPAGGAYQGLLGQVNPLTTQGINQNIAQLYGGYNQNVMQPAQSLLGGYLQGGPLTAQQVGANAQALMSPYTQSVIGPTMQLGQQALAQNLQQVGAGANQAGAFGGSRQGVMEGVAQSQAALGEQAQIGNMLNTAWNNALTPAYNIGALGSAQGFNAANNLATLGQGGYEQAMTQGQNLAGVNLNAGLTAAQGAGNIGAQIQGLGTSIGSLGNQYLQQQLSETGALGNVGTAQQQQQQALLNAQIGNYYGTQNMPIQNLDLLLSSITGVPYGTTSTMQGTGTTQTNPGLMNEITGGIGAATNLVGLGNTIGGWF